MPTHIKKKKKIWISHEFFFFLFFFHRNIYGNWYSKNKFKSLTPSKSLAPLSRIVLIKSEQLTVHSQMSYRGQSNYASRTKSSKIYHHVHRHCKQRNQGAKVISKDKTKKKKKSKGISFYDCSASLSHYSQCKFESILNRLINK